MEPKKVSKKLLKRLPVYLNYLRALPESIINISATTIAKSMGLGDVMVRKDLAKVSNGGRRKLGYIRENLIRDIEKFLDMNSTACAIIVGAGKIGQALLAYEGFEKSGIQILAGFDVDPPARQADGAKPIYPADSLEAFCHDTEVTVGIITVPAEYAQSVCDRLVACGIRAIWNFAPVHLKVPNNVFVQSENLAASLTALCLQLRTAEALGEE